MLLGRLVDSGGLLIMANIETFPHQDKAFFKISIESTQAATNFSSRLIEKDYYCSLILQLLYESTDSQIVFKGGTSLNKIHVGFYRLSEDLDFSIAISPKASRSERSKKAQPFKQLVEKIAVSIPNLVLKDSLKGANNSTQYRATFEYLSLFTTKPDTILFEVGLREEVLEQPVQCNANTLVKDPFNGDTLLPLFSVICLTQSETYAEKVRAALSREEPAIRDLFDIDYAIHFNKLPMNNSEFIELVKTKLTIPTKRVIDLSEKRKQSLERQLAMELKPVLRPADFDAFDFESAWKLLCGIGSIYL